MSKTNVCRKKATKRPAAEPADGESESKVGRTYNKWSLDDLRICLSLSSDVWTDFLENRHAKSENNADKGCSNAVAKLRLLKCVLDENSGISEALRDTLTPVWPTKEDKLPASDPRSQSSQANKLYKKLSGIVQQYTQLRAYLKRGAFPSSRSHPVAVSVAGSFVTSARVVYRGGNYWWRSSGQVGTRRLEQSK